MITAANFQNFKISPDFPINFRKSHQISKNYLKSSESYGKKPLGVPKEPPSLNRVKHIPDLRDHFNEKEMHFKDYSGENYNLGDNAPMGNGGGVGGG